MAEGGVTGLRGHVIIMAISMQSGQRIAFCFAVIVIVINVLTGLVSLLQYNGLCHQVSWSFHMEREYRQLQQFTISRPHAACNCSRRTRVLDLPRYARKVETPTSSLSVHDSANEIHRIERQLHSFVESRSVPSRSDSDIPTVFAITPTYARATQKVDMTSVCQTFMLVPKLVWIVIEDSPEKTRLVTDLLARCKVQSVHLNARTPAKYHAQSEGHKKPRGVAQRNAGLKWLRKHYTLSNCNGVVYFADDDNKYDLRLFDVIRQTRNVSVFMIGFVGRQGYGGPKCENGKAVLWRAGWAPWRNLPVDMAGFAINLRNFFKKPRVKVGYDIRGHSSRNGYLETNLLEHFATRETVECIGLDHEVLVWHTKTQTPDLTYEKYAHFNYTVQY